MLEYETGNARVDARLGAFVEALRGDFPQRLRAVYLTGSWREGRAVSGSDLDVILVLSGFASLEDADTLKARTEAFNARGGPELGPWGMDDEDLGAPVPGYVKTAARLWGEDVFSRLEQMSTPEVHRRWTLGSLRLLRMLRRADAPLQMPEEEGGPFGYDLGGPQAPRIKLMVSTVARMAGARAAARGVQVESKSMCFLRYREVVGGEDADFVERLHRTARLGWEYGWPETSEGEAELGSLCAGLAQMERRFLLQVKAWCARARLSELEADRVWAEACARHLSM